MDILFDEMAGEQGDLGIITLNRPQALNALTLELCIALDKQLALWAEQQHIKAVIIRGAGDRAFCAGGDIVSLYHKAMAGDYESLSTFFCHEYQLNARIHHYPKSYIAFMDGITMGGGAGVSIHGSHRVATERLTFAMPETAIGFFPDIGATYFLSRCQGEMGTYLGLTGKRLAADHMAYLGLSDHTISSEKIEDVIHQLAVASDGSKDSVSKILSSFSTVPGDSELAREQDQVDHCFASDNIQLIFERLYQYGSDWAKDTLDQLKKKSPTSLVLTLKALRQGREQDFERCMQTEYRLAQFFIQSKDFYEGVRAMVIDKDYQPRWSPSKLQDVSASSPPEE